MHVEAQLVAQLEESVRPSDGPSIGHRLAASGAHVEAYADDVQAESASQLHQGRCLRHAVAAEFHTQRALANGGVAPDTNQYSGNK